MDVPDTLSGGGLA